MTTEININVEALNDLNYFRQMRRQFYTNQTPENWEAAMKAARKVLENRRAAERKIKGRASTRITDKNLRKMMR